MTIVNRDGWIKVHGIWRKGRIVAQDLSAVTCTVLVDGIRHTIDAYQVELEEPSEAALQAKWRRAAEFLRSIAYPKRGTEEEKQDIFDVAARIQQSFTLEELE